MRGSILLRLNPISSNATIDERYLAILETCPEGDVLKRKMGLSWSLAGALSLRKAMNFSRLIDDSENNVARSGCNDTLILCFAVLYYHMSLSWVIVSVQLMISFYHSSPYPLCQS